MSMFEAGSPWQNALSHVQVFQLAQQDVRATNPGLSDSDLTTIVSFLAAHHIKLSVAWAVIPKTTCTEDVTGAVAMANRVKSLGGTIDYLRMDEPLTFGHFLTCGLAISQVAQDSADVMQGVQTVFPNVQVADVEATGAAPTGIYSATLTSDVQEFLTDFANGFGTPIRLFDFDVQWSISNWDRGLSELVSVLQQNSIPFGVIFDGVSQGNSTWMEQAEMSMHQWASLGLPTPDYVDFEDWTAYPDHVLPESDATAFTYLVDYYFTNSWRQPPPFVPTCDPLSQDAKVGSGLTATAADAAQNNLSWGGYVNAEAAGQPPLAGSSLQWQVPTVTSEGSARRSLIWSGLGGSGDDAITVGAGTGQDVSAGGAGDYYFWYGESGSGIRCRLSNLSVSTGDLVEVQVTAVPNAQSGSTVVGYTFEDYTQLVYAHFSITYSGLTGGDAYSLVERPACDANGDPCLLSKFTNPDVAFDRAALTWPVGSPVSRGCISAVPYTTMTMVDDSAEPLVTVSAPGCLWTATRTAND